MNRGILEVIKRLSLWERARVTALGSLIALLLCAIPAAGVAFAAAPPGATSITVYAAKAVDFGQRMQIKARLVDAKGAPISGAKVQFVVPGTFFLGATSDVQIADVQTDKDGVAETDYQARDAGSLEVRAQFLGSDRYQASRASAKIQVQGTPSQLYVPRAGVQVPGLDLGPNQQPAADSQSVGATSQPKGLASLWPTVSPWPVLLVLAIVWSCYGFAASQMFRIARAGGDLALAAADGASGALEPEGKRPSAEGPRKGEGR